LALKEGSTGKIYEGEDTSEGSVTWLETNLGNGKVILGDKVTGEKGTAAGILARMANRLGSVKNTV